ncbi:MAG: DNA-directed RNA polymerase subunit B'' [Candidatus Rehaiarchaeum fermentans]|nr:DNA-directed RNA polymerase subunit B'' [Candidatus Rehaiarchaeum fermentans]
MNPVQQYALLKSFYAQFGYAPVHIKSFERFVEDKMPRIAKSTEIVPKVTIPGYKSVSIKIDSVKLGKPEIREKDGTIRLLYPMECRIRDLTYSAPLIANVSFIGDGEKLKQEEVVIGELPVIVRSKYCNLYGMSRENLINKAREDPDDPGGYFIINGTERLIMTTEDLAPNKIVVTKSTQEGIEYSARIYADAGSIKLPHNIIMAKNGQFYITLGVFKKLHVMALVKVLGINNKEDIISFTNAPEKAKWILEANWIEADKEEKEILEHFSKSSGIFKKRSIYSGLDNFLLPFLGQDPKSRVSKAIYILYAIGRILRHWVEGTEDDRDSYSNKRVHAEDYNLEIIFSTSMKALAKDAANAFNDIVQKQKKLPPAQYIFSQSVLVRRLLSSISTGIWPGSRTGVTEQLSRGSFYDTLSYLRRVKSLITSNRENSSARVLHGTHYGRLCIIETPEDASVGLVKNLATLAYVVSDVESKERDQVEKLLKDEGVKLR